MKQEIKIGFSQLNFEIVFVWREGDVTAQQELKLFI